MGSPLLPVQCFLTLLWPTHATLLWELCTCWSLYLESSSKQPVACPSIIAKCQILSEDAKRPPHETPALGSHVPSTSLCSPCCPRVFTRFSFALAFVILVSIPHWGTGDPISTDSASCFLIYTCSSVWYDAGHLNTAMYTNAPNVPGTQ